MMPQKLNPDVAELARGKAGTAIGRLTGLLATMKGLPLAYNLDLQEDKPPVFAARRDIGAGARAPSRCSSADLELDRDRLAQAASDPLLLATDAAERLVARGRAVSRRARAGGRSWSARMSSTAAVTPAESVAARRAPGPGGVRSGLAEARERLQA